MATFLGLLHMLFTDTEDVFNATSPSLSTDSSCSSSVSSPCLQTDESGRLNAYLDEQFLQGIYKNGQQGVTVQNSIGYPAPLGLTQPAPFNVWQLDPWNCPEPYTPSDGHHANAMVSVPDTIDDESINSCLSDCFSCVAPVQGDTINSYPFTPIPTIPPFGEINDSAGLPLTTSPIPIRRKVKSKASYVSSDLLEKPYACPHCHHRSRRRHNLREHMQTHNPHRRREFVCQFCNRPFARKYDMKRHEKLHGHH